MPPNDRSRPGGGGSSSDQIANDDDTATLPPAAPYQLLPPLTGDEYVALKADIAANGVLVPIIVDQHRTVIDGHHRKQIADELGIPCPYVVREFANDEDRHELALGLNLKRRHLTREQMRELIAAECARTPDASDREIARRLGCSPTTVGTVRRPVSNLDTPRVTHEEAEETIRRGLDQVDEAMVELLTLGMPPAEVAAVLLEMWTRFRKEFDDAEVSDAMWRHMISPRVAAILGGQPVGSSGGAP